MKRHIHKCAYCNYQFMIKYSQLVARCPRCKYNAVYGPENNINMSILSESDFYYEFYDGKVDCEGCGKIIKVGENYYSHGGGSHTCSNRCFKIYERHQILGWENWYLKYGGKGKRGNLAWVRYRREKYQFGLNLYNYLSQYTFVTSINVMDRLRIYVSECKNIENLLARLTPEQREIVEVAA